jgi:hypothetical protein
LVHFNFENGFLNLQSELQTEAIPNEKVTTKVLIFTVSSIKQIYERPWAEYFGV